MRAGAAKAPAVGHKKPPHPWDGAARICEFGLRPLGDLALRRFGRSGWRRVVRRRLLAFLAAMCFLCLLRWASSSSLRRGRCVGGGGSGRAAGAVVSVWAIAARGAKTIAALIPMAVNVFSILHSPFCSTLGRWRARACAPSDELAMNIEWRELGAATGLTRLRARPYEPPGSSCPITLSDISFASPPLARVTGRESGASLTAVRRAFPWKRLTFRPNSTGGGLGRRASPPNAASRTRREFSPA